MIEKTKPFEEQQRAIKDTGAQIKDKLSSAMELLPIYYRNNAEEYGMSYNALLKAHHLIEDALTMFSEVDERVNKNLDNANSVPVRKGVPKRSIGDN